jgi:hypothetical protein
MLGERVPWNGQVRIVAVRCPVRCTLRTQGRDQRTHWSRPRKESQPDRRSPVGAVLNGGTSITVAIPIESLHFLVQLPSLPRTQLSWWESSPLGSGMTSDTRIWRSAAEGTGDSGRFGPLLTRSCVSGRISLLHRGRIVDSKTRKTSSQSSKCSCL